MAVVAADAAAGEPNDERIDLIAQARNVGIDDGAVADHERKPDLSACGVTGAANEGVTSARLSTAPVSTVRKMFTSSPPCLGVVVSFPRWFRVSTGRRLAGILATSARLGRPSFKRISPRRTLRSTSALTSPKTQARLRRMMLAGVPVPTVCGQSACFAARPPCPTSALVRFSVESASMDTIGAHRGCY